MDSHKNIGKKVAVSIRMSRRTASHKLSHSNPKKRMPFANNGTVADMYPPTKKQKTLSSSRFGSRAKPLIKKMTIYDGEN